MFQIIQGGLMQMPVRLIQSINGFPGDPLDLTAMTAMSCCFQNTDGTETTLTFAASAITVVGNALLGKILITASATQTALFSTADIGTLELSIAFGGDPLKVQIPNAYIVLPAVC